MAARTVSTSNTNIRIRYTHSQSGTGVCMKYFFLFFFTTKRYLSQSLCKWIIMAPFFLIFIDKLINFFLMAVEHLYDTMCWLKGLFVLIKWIFFFFCLFCIRKPGHTLNIDDKECLNFATFNFLGFVGNEKIEVIQWFSFSLDRLLRIKEELFTLRLCWNYLQYLQYLSGHSHQKFTSIWCRFLWSPWFLWDNR